MENKNSVSVVIPAAQDSKIDVLESLKNQEIKPFQTIIVIGKNTSKNRNIGAKKAKGELIAFVNAHGEFPLDWTSRINKFFEEHPEIDIVGGPQFTPKNSGYFERTSGYALSSLFGSAEASNRYSGSSLKLNADEADLTSSNLICKKEVLEKIQFDETLYPGEDPKFISDAKKANLQVAFSPEIIGYNKRRGTYFGLCKQIFNYGKVRPKKEDFMETIKKPYFLVPSLFVLYLVLLIFSHFFTFSDFIFLPIGFYFLLDIIFSLYESLKNKDLKASFLLLLVFPTIHISYGVGLLYGYFKKFFKTI